MAATKSGYRNTICLRGNTLALSRSSVYLPPKKRCTSMATKVLRTTPAERRRHVSSGPTPPASGV